MISFILACVWIIAAKMIAMFPSRDHHWRAAYWLMAAGAPLLVWIIWRHGPGYAVAAILAGGWVLRWPVYYLWRRIRSLLR